MQARLRNLMQSYVDALCRIGIRRRSDEGFPPEASRDRKIRRGLAATLSVIGLVLLLEVVVMPGLLFRRPLYERLQTDEADTAPARTTGFIPGLTSSIDERAVRRQRLQNRIHSRSGEHQIAAANLRAEWASTVLIARDQLGIDIVHEMPNQPPSRLAAIIRDVPSAVSAWRQLRETATATRDAIARADTDQTLVMARFASNTFLPEDDAEIVAKTVATQTAAARARKARDDIFHLSFLVRAHAWLAPSNSGTIDVP